MTPAMWKLVQSLRNQGPKAIKLSSCSTQLSMKFQMLVSIKISRNSDFLGSEMPKMLFFMLINVKMPTTVGILTIMGRTNLMLCRIEHDFS